MYSMTLPRKCWGNDKKNSTNDLPGATYTLETQERICGASCHKTNNHKTNPKMKKDPVCWTTKVDYVDTIKSWLEGCLQGWLYVCIHNTEWLEQEYKYIWIGEWGDVTVLLGCPFSFKFLHQHSDNSAPEAMKLKEIHHTSCLGYKQQRQVKPEATHSPRCHIESSAH
jgi:hypothetical protein